MAIAMVECTYDILSKEEIQDIKERLAASNYEFRTIRIDECNEKQRYLNCIGKEGNAECIYIEVEFSLPKGPHVKTQVSGKLVSGKGNKEAEDAKSMLEQIYQDVIDKRAPSIAKAYEGTSVHSAGQSLMG